MLFFLFGKINNYIKNKNKRIKELLCPYSESAKQREQFQYELSYGKLKTDNFKFVSEFHILIRKINK